MLARLTIKRRFFVTITAVLVGTSLVVGIISFFTGRSQLHKGYASLANTQYGLFTSIIENDAKGLSRAQVGLTRIESLQRLFVERKWDALLAAASPIFDELRKNENVTHMYFIDMGGRVFLRVHRPEISGDKLTRVTYLKSASTNKSVWGIEMGQNTFSLRCVHPYYYHGKQIGFFEVAEEVDHVISQMKRINGDEVGIFLSNEFMSTKPTQVHNETIGNFTILDSTDKETTLALATALGDDLTRGLKERQVQFISNKGRSYVIALTPFTDANEEVAGVIISHLDITSQIHNMWLGIFFNILTFVLIIAGGALLLIFSLRKSLNLFQSVKEHILAVTTDWDLHRRLKVETTDEVGELGADFNRLTEKLSEIVRKVNDASGEISSISHDIFQASKKVVRGAELQAHGVEVTSSAVMQINASVNGVAQGVDSLSLSASESSSSILEMAAS
ncbi:MAG TPA: cache domain-containing protein, partial [Geobacterales bacterium]|nr:cache domain-containing protein [Geobacterales bacterium]